MRALVVTLSAAVGLLVGVRGAMGFTVSGAGLFFLEPLLLPAESLGLEWSSLVVYPAAAIPQVAVESGAHLVIVNSEPTPLDHLASAVIRGRAGAVLPPRETPSPASHRGLAPWRAGPRRSRSRA